MSTDKPNLYIDEKAVAAVDAKIMESKALTGGMMSSWANPMEGVSEGPMGKVTAPKIKTEPEIVPRGTPPGAAAFVKVPAQAMKSFKQLLTLFGELEVRFTAEQKNLFLGSLQTMPTPKIMSDAKAIFTLMEALSK